MGVGGLSLLLSAFVAWRLQRAIPGSGLPADIPTATLGSNQRRGTRIAEFGTSPNKLAALGLNLLLLVHLLGTAWATIGFLRGKRPFASLEHWQTRYLPAYGAWAAIVVVAFGPIFGFA